MSLYRTSLLLVLSLLLLPAHAEAQGADQCSTAVTQAGRNELLQVSDVDVRSYYYQKICQTDATSIGLNYSNVVKELLSQASSLLGVTYSSKSEYCREEEKYFSAHTYNYLRTSLVVEKALDNWLECIRITSKGIKVVPTIETPRVVLGVERAGRTAGVISGVSTTPGIACEAMLYKRTGTAVKQERVDLSKSGVVLPEVEAVSIICDRSGTASTEETGGTVYPAGMITLITSEGPFNFRFDEEQKGPEKWARSIGERIDTLKASTVKDIAEVGRQLAALGVVQLDNCKWEPFATPAHDELLQCSDPNWVARGIGPGSKGGEWRLQCCSLSLVK